jgi:hypothetical protein
MGVIEGASSDVVLLAAHYDTADVEAFEFVGANDGASGPAVLLELGRLLSESTFPFTVWLAFVDGDAFGEAGAEPAYHGSRALVERLVERGELSGIRLAVYFNQVCDWDLNIARDLRSHPVYRQVFWDSARDLGREEAFAPERELEAPAGGHHAFLEHDMRRVVALVDDRLGGETQPGPLWHSKSDVPVNCSAESLGIVGSVSHEALMRIADQLQRIDHYRLRGHQVSLPDLESVTRESDTQETHSQPAGDVSPLPGAPQVPQN